MTSRNPPKPKKKAADKDHKKAPGPKLVAKDIKPGLGHNSGKFNAEAVKMAKELMHFSEQKKAIGKAERDIRNRFKTELGIMASSVSRLIRELKLDKEVFQQQESNYQDLRIMVGDQFEMFAARDMGKPANDKKLQPEPEEDDEGFEVEEEEEETGVIEREG